MNTFPKDKSNRNNHCNKVITIASSLTFIDKIKEYENKFLELGYKVNIPFKEKGLYHQDIKKFNTYVVDSNILFILNEKKEGIDGYIGNSVYSELIFALSLNVIYNKNIKIILLNMPSPKVNCYEEILMLINEKQVELYKENML